MAPRDVMKADELDNRVKVFTSRETGGEALAALLGRRLKEDELILALPAGGAPVAAALARIVVRPWNVYVVSKATLPWSTEQGYGAVAEDGTVRLNHDLVAALGLSANQVERGIERARAKVQGRAERFHALLPLPRLRGRTLVVVDDGLASGFTMQAALEALRGEDPRALVVAVPTGHRRAVERVSELADSVLCANLRSGTSFAVADAYEHWHDVKEEEVSRLMLAEGQRLACQ